MFALYFAVGGCLAFTIFLIQAVRAALRSFSHTDRGGPGGVAVATVVLMSIAAIDTAFVVLLLRAIQVTMHSPTAG